METKVFPLPAVAEALQRYVEARIHLDTGSDEHMRRYAAMQQRMVGAVSRPTYVLIDPRTEAILDSHQGWMPQGNGAAFAAFLNAPQR
jgi:hypothetical protein